MTHLELSLHHSYHIPQLVVALSLGRIHPAESNEAEVGQLRSENFEWKKKTETTHNSLKKTCGINL